MKQFAMQQNAIGSSREEIRSSVPMSVMVMDWGETMVCPKPRRLGLLNTSFNDHPVRSIRCQLSPQGEFCDSKPGSDVLDMILSKGGCGVEESRTRVESPPSRVANPLIHDARFGDAPLSELSPIQPPSSSSRKGSCVWANFGNKPAVRVEGFDCLDRDSRNCSIPTLA
ncbi:hypothetical protein like AT1G68490 [Hibiscus trionum]|uniref:Uncharacterized protein n=1 Tax=Hibiscus trionum TaxID=183268 RepID=A0A9W7H599_HIBTR|nr:hypothetical protein like AT1G68490 [Hibiscus trionum]